MLMLLYGGKFIHDNTGKRIPDSCFYYVYNGDNWSVRYNHGGTILNHSRYNQVIKCW